LRTLSPNQKKKWTEYLPEIVYAYNCTPHSSTGYSPYYLFFGRDPRLPIDYLIGLPMDEQDGDGDEWVSEHHNRLKEAFEFASKRTELEALLRKTFNDKNVGTTDLQIGARVYCRDHTTRGRNKIQDIWCSIPYKVIARPNPNGNVYVVEPLEGTRPTKTVNRTELLDSRTLVDAGYTVNDPVNPIGQRPLAVSDDEDEYVMELEVAEHPGDEVHTVPTDGSQEAIRTIQVSVHVPPTGQDAIRDNEVPGVGVPVVDVDTGVNVGNGQDPEAFTPDKAGESNFEPVSELDTQSDPVGTVEPLPRDAAPRMSTRETAGYHPNPHHLPRSAVQQDIQVHTMTTTISSEVLAHISRTQLLLVHLLAGVNNQGQ